MMQSNFRNASVAIITTDRRSLACALVTVCGLSVAATAQLAKNPAPNPNTGNVQQAEEFTAERMLVPMGSRGSQRLKVLKPDAYSTEALETAGFPGVLQAHAPRRTLYGEIAFLAESREAANAAVEHLQAQFPWMNSAMLVESSSLEGVYSINLRSVRNAIRAVDLISGQPGIQEAFVNYEREHSNRSPRGGGDPALPAQWHINNISNPAADHRIQEVHDLGITGAGVVVGILEAFRGNFTSPYDPDSLAIPGYDYSDTVHPDLFANFNQGLSQITDPFQIDVSHETSVAGLVASTADNGIFGRGVAYGAQLAALRNGSTIEIAEAWAHQLQDIDIINNSWGPNNTFFPYDTTGRFAIGEDDFEVSPPLVVRVPLATFTDLSIERALDLGRASKGRIFVFSAGNSSHFQGWNRFLLGNAVSLPQFGYLDIVDIDAPPEGNQDDFALDGADVEGWRYSGMIGDRSEYWEAAGHPFTFSIGAIDEFNTRAGYSTTGTSIIAAGYSQGSTLFRNFIQFGGYPGLPSGRGMTTTSPLGDGFDFGCPVPLRIDGLTCSFNGTSASAPIVSGIFALLLETNPALTVRDIQHIIQRTSVPVNFDPQASYWTNLFGFGTPDPDSSSPTFWQVNSGDVLHSDEYGFGVIDAEAAVAAAATWGTLPRLQVLDSGPVETQVDIPDATFEELGNIGTEEEPKILHQLIPGEAVSAARTLPNGSVTGLACVRENLLVETVEITITVAGAGPGDLLVVLQSPRGSVSPLAIPRADSSGTIVGSDEFAYFNYTFSTYKHWGELSGGTWNLFLQDFRPDEETPEGTLPTMTMDDPPVIEDPGEEHVTLLGPLGLPGAGFFEHTEKSLVGFQLKVYGTETGLAPTLACPAVLTSCPGDLNADGIVTVADLALFIQLYNEGDLQVDLDGDGVITFNDLRIFIGLWRPGPCSPSGLPFNRPRPGSINPNAPIVRPV